MKSFAGSAIIRGSSVRLAGSVMTVMTFFRGRKTTLNCPDGPFQL